MTNTLPSGATYALMNEKSPVWRGQTQLSSSPPNSPMERGGTYASRTSRRVVEMNIRYDLPASISEMLIDFPGWSACACLVISAIRSSIAFVRASGSMESLTALITSAVTSRIVSVIVAVSPRAWISSPRVPARNPLVR